MSQQHTDLSGTRYTLVAQGKKLLATAVVFSSLFAAHSSLADSGSAHVNSVNPAQIEVASDGSKYTVPVIPLVSLTAQVGIELDAGVFGKVKSWESWLMVKTETGISVHFSQHKAKASYDLPRPKTVNTGAAINIPYGTLSPYLTEQCNLLANNLRSQGQSNQQIFSQDRVIPIGVGASVNYEMTNLKGAPTPQEVESWENKKKFNLICKAAPQEPVNPTRNVPDVDQATLTIHEVSTLGGTCKLNLSGVIVTKEANKQVKFRYKDDSGKQSDIKTVMTDHAKTAMFNHQYSLGGGGLKQGKIRIAIEGENTSSPWSNYSVNCGGHNAPGGVTAKPGTSTTDVAKGAAGNFAPEGRDTPVVPVVPVAGSIKADLGKPDLMATPLGMSLAGAKRAWGSTVVLNNPNSASAKGVGAGNKMCRFSPAAFRPFNKGTAPSGMFNTTVYRNNQPVHNANFNLAAQSGLAANGGWHNFDLELAQGMNIIKVELDSGKAVAESDEGNNSYTLKVRVDFPCSNRPSQSGIKPLAPTPVKPVVPTGTRIKPVGG